MSIYLDASVILGIVLQQRPRPIEWAESQPAFSSELVALEGARVIERFRLQRLLREEGIARARSLLESLLADVAVVELNTSVLRRASGPMGSIVGALDAIHLASALIVEEQTGDRPVFATHDRQQGLAAGALGLEVTGL